MSASELHRYVRRHYKKLLGAAGAASMAVWLYEAINPTVSEAEKGGGTVQDLMVMKEWSAEELAAAAQEETAQFKAPPDVVRPILVLYGTEYGASKEIAELLCERVSEVKGLWGRAVNMEDYDWLEFEKEQCVLIVCSTYGDGVPPTTAREFFEHLEACAKSASLNLSHIAYTVCALGDGTYPHFCAAGKQMDELFSTLGATSFVPRKDVDQEDWNIINKWLDASLKALPALDLKEAPDYLYEKQCSGEIGPKEIRVSRNYPLVTTVKEKRLLTVVNDRLSDKETWHIEFELAGHELPYRCGDSLAVLPHNPTTEVELLLSLFNDDGTRKLATPSWHYASFNGSREKPAQLTLRQALTMCFDLKNVKPEILTHLLARCQQHGVGGEEEERLVQLAGRGVGKEVKELHAWLEERELSDVFQAFPQSAGSDLMEYVEKGLFRALLPRYYSISSSHEYDANTVSVTVAVVRYVQHERERKGVCSTYLADALQVGSEASIFVNNNPDFRLPRQLSTPIIMIGPGTGLAPYRAFLQNRLLVHAQHQEESGTADSDHVLFFGCRHRNKDYLYGDWLEELSEKKLLSLYTAFSRDQGEKVYVQNLVRQEGELLWRLVNERGAHIYICGDAQYMAKDVHEALIEVFQQHGELTQEDANILMSKLEVDGRLQKDTWF